jgi:hypothetical protein
MTRGLVVALVVLAAMAALGEAAHVVLDEMNAVVAHHFFHIVFPVIAFAIFGTLVGRDVRTHGWPTFSWRLQPKPASRGGEATSE